VVRSGLYGTQLAHVPLLSANVHNASFALCMVMHFLGINTTVLLGTQSGLLLESAFQKAVLVFRHSTVQ